MERTSEDLCTLNSCTKIIPKQQADKEGLEEGDESMKDLRVMRVREW